MTYFKAYLYSDVYPNRLTNVFIYTIMLSSFNSPQRGIKFQNTFVILITLAPGVHFINPIVEEGYAVLVYNASGVSFNQK